MDNEFNSAVNRLLTKGYKKQDIDRYSFNKYLMNVCLNNKIKFIDLTFDLAKASLHKELYQKDNVHLSAAGIDVCANVLAQKLE